MKQLPLFAVFFIMGCNALLIRAEPQLSADNGFQFDQATKTVTGTGNAQLADKHLLLRADEIKLSEPEHSVSAAGNVSLNLPKTRIVTDGVSYNLVDGKLRSRRFAMGSWPFYMSGRDLEADFNGGQGRDITVYAGEPDAFAPNVKVKEFEINVEEHFVQAEGAQFRVGTVPVFYWPHIKLDTRRSIMSFDGTLGFNKSLGAYVQTTTLFPTIYPIKAGAILDYYTKRGLLIGPAVSYDYSGLKTTYAGDLRTGFIDDHGDLGVNTQNQPISKDRYFVEWRHKQFAYERVELTAVVSAWSDSYVTRDFRPNYYTNNQIPDSFFQGTYLGENSYTTLFARFRPNSFEQVVTRLPEASFHLNATPILSTQVLQELDAAVANLYLDPINGAPALSAVRFNALYTVYRSIELTNGLTFTPVAHAMFTQYVDIKGTGGRDSYTRVLTQVGFDLEATVTGTWSYESDVWRIRGIRHIMRPYVAYRYLPNGSAGSSVIPRLDADVFSTYLPAIDLSEMRHIDQLNTMNVMRLGLRNSVQTREGLLGSRDLAYANFFDDIRFHRRTGERMWSNFFADIGIFPARWINIGVVWRVDPSNMRTTQSQVYLGFLDGTLWSARLFTDFLRGAFTQYGLEVGFKLNERNGFSARWRYDADTKVLAEQAYGYRMKLGNSWEVAAEILYRKHSTRENGLTANFMLMLLDFPIFNT